MSGSQEDDTEKSHEPTQHKLDEARKKGELARSADLNTAAAYGGFLLAALAIGASSVGSVSTAMMVLLGQAGDFADLVFEGPAAGPVGGLLGTIALGLLAWFLIPAVSAMLSVFAQRAFVFAPTKLQPKLSRISPVSNAKNKYGLSGLFEFAKSFAKLFFYSVLLAAYLSLRLPEMAGSLHAEPQVIGALMAKMLIEFLFVVFVIAASIGVVDFIWQHFDHQRKNRMSHREVKEEHKQNEGDPHMKQERRQRATQIASQQMIVEVPGADVVIVNPTHYAVALKWSRLPGAAPICVAKGVDHVALAIRDAAMAHGVPVRSDPPTARAVYAMTQIGDEIDPQHYRAVAAAIRFAEAMRQRARAWS
ncbi:Flagellar biosynthetic protein FlhB [Roseovarius sp. THAF9]|uniref:EscU/YscU/HrcU family type III secretion system export apparatus switch protein n=1 Tax=Roseovarius sp. THAF9 TaxID=2587847 RepID=UPI001268266E|nr:flagellar type III secretion system protein FlhB [Roseovarius sp. THAF9]QFT95152.1 Flagellar biosynthetic protein FlhB [Roseovarius sp. THAF9]